MSEMQIPMTNVAADTDLQGKKYWLIDGGEFVTKDSGERQKFDSGMVRDTTEGKLGWHRIAEGPMLRRWAGLLTRGAVKYPDIAPGRANWTLANGEAEYQRFRESAFRHFMTWYLGDDYSEDHAAAIIFNVNGCEYVREKMRESRS